MQQANRKRHRRYLFYRAYCVTVAVAWNVAGFVLLTEDPHAGLVFFILVPVVIPAIFMLSNLMAFRFPFSVFGPLERTPAPPEPPLQQIRETWGAINFLLAAFPWCAWKLYQGGIAFSVFGIGTGYVPFDEFVQVEASRLGPTIRHNSPEVRSPLHLPPGKLARHLHELWNEHCSRKTQSQC